MIHDRDSFIEGLEIIAELNRRGIALPIPDTEPTIDQPKTISFEPIRGLLDGLRPVPDLTVTEWANTYRFLSSVSSAEPGRYNSKRAPYVEQPMDCLSPSHPCKFVVVMKGAQTFFSEIGWNWIGYSIHLDPGPILVINPTDQTMQDNSKLRLAPMIEATPVLAERVAPPKSRGSENSLLFKSFPGGVIRMVGSNSAAGLRSMPAKKIMFDEIDGYPNDVDNEGSPLALGIKRADTYGDRAKIYILSTPTDAASKIHAEFMKTDQRHYYVPCPHCGEFDWIRWENIKWERNGDVFTAWLACTACGAMIEERHKTWMLAHGQWIAHRPDLASSEKVGFHLSGLYSPLGMFSWSQAARQYVEAFETKNDATLKKTFVNLVEGRIYEEDQERPPWKWLHERSGAYQRNQLPEHGPMFITCGVDVQRDRLELEIVAWGLHKQSWSVDYRVIAGDPATIPNQQNPHDGQVWQELDGVLRQTWLASGMPMPVAITGIDSGDGTTTAAVYDAVEWLCNRGLRVVALKGRDAQVIAIAPGGKPEVTTTNKKSGRMFYHVGVSMLKSELYGFLNLERNTDGTYPAGYCHFPDYGEEYFKGLTAEAIIVRNDSNGHPKQVWVKIHARNEPLDCRNYARAVAALGGNIDRDQAGMEEMRGHLAQRSAAIQQRQAQPQRKRPKPNPSKSIWD